MKQTQIIMGMPITVEIVDSTDEALFNQVFDYFREVDDRFSPYKEDSELSALNSGLNSRDWSAQMTEVVRLCEQTKQISGGYFNIENEGKIDTSGLVKGWAIDNAAKLLKDNGIENFYIEAGGDIQAEGLNTDGEPWRVGIRNPFDIDDIIKVVELSSKGIATSGTYIRGQHIYDPSGNRPQDIVSLTVIAPNIFEADRFATAAFAMGSGGISFIDALPGFAGYMIDQAGVATYTSNFEAYVR